MRYTFLQPRDVVDFEQFISSLDGFFLLFPFFFFLIGQVAYETLAQHSHCVSRNVFIQRSPIGEKSAGIIIKVMINARINAILLNK